MLTNKEQKRKKTRLRDFDYSKNGVYFITICTENRKNILSEITQDNVGVGASDDPIVKLKESGIIVEEEIIKMNNIYPELNVSKYIIMPNHIHFLIEVNKKTGSSRAPTPTRANQLVPKYISTLKRFTNKRVGNPIWQRSYFDHIIRDEEDLALHLQYIEQNPRKWLLGKDEYYA